MELLIKNDTATSGWPNVYTEGSLKIDIVSANSVDPDEMPLSVAFHLGCHCLPFMVFLVLKGLKELQ